jgi:hypothetical protein
MYEYVNRCTSQEWGGAAGLKGSTSLHSLLYYIATINFVGSSPNGHEKRFNE